MGSVRFFLSSWISLSLLLIPVTAWPAFYAVEMLIHEQMFNGRASIPWNTTGVMETFQVKLHGVSPEIEGIQLKMKGNGKRTEVHADYEVWRLELPYAGVHVIVKLFPDHTAEYISSRSDVKAVKFNKLTPPENYNEP